MLTENEIFYYTIESVLSSVVLIIWMSLPFSLVLNNLLLQDPPRCDMKLVFFPLKLQEEPGRS